LKTHYTLSITVCQWIFQKILEAFASFFLLFSSILTASGDSAPEGRFLLTNAFTIYYNSGKSDPQKIFQNFLFFVSYFALLIRHI